MATRIPGLIVACTCLLVSATVVAEETIRDGARSAGHAIGSTIRDIGQGAKKVGKDIGQGAKEAGKTVGSAAAEGGRAVKKGVKGEK